MLSVLPLDMSLEQTNIIISVGVTVKSIGTVINPIIMGFMVQNHVRLKCLNLVSCPIVIRINETKNLDFIVI